MKTYILKPGRALSTAKGIVGPPADPENPTAKELVTEKHFKNWSAGLNALLAHKNCPLQALEIAETKSVDELIEKLGEKIEQSKTDPEGTPKEKPQVNAKSTTSTGAIRK